MPDLLSDASDALPPPPSGLRIIEFVAENIKRIEVVQIRPDGEIVEITGKNGAGKQQPVSEPVLTPHGWRPIGEIAIGDQVIGASGQAVEVVGVFPQETRETYRVLMADGASTRCGPDHLWTVIFWCGGGDKGWRRETETISTRQLIEGGLRRGTGRKYALPIVAPVQFADSGMELPVDPYTLGVILGDGHIEPTGYVTVTSWDAEILDKIEPPDCWRSERELGSGFWSRPLRHMGLGGKRSWEKFVPRPYLWASPEARTALLAGLLDTDGTAPDSWAEFGSASEQLVDDVIHLALSLGHVCRKRKGITKKYRYNGELKEGRLAWGVTIKSWETPFVLKRKAEAWSRSEKRGDQLRFIDTIERIDDEKSVCIKVAAPDGLYVTKDFILTHNTSVLDALWWTLAGAKEIAEEPIRQGTDEAFCQIDLGEYIVRRNISKTEAGITTSLSVRAPNGAEYRRPQETVDRFFNRLSLDPLAFLRMDGKEKFALVRQFVPDVDFEAVELDQQADIANRRDLNAQVRQLKGVIAKFHVPNEYDLPEQPINIDALQSELTEAGRLNGETEVRRTRREGVEASIETKRRRAEEMLTEAHDLARRASEMGTAANVVKLEADELEQKLREAPPLPEPVDTAAILARLNQAHGINTQIDVVRQRREAEADVRRIEAEAKALTDAMAARQREVDAKIAAAAMPIPGLTLTTGGGVRLNDLPFEQASDAEQLRTSIALAMAMNPRLKVIRVRDGSLLDSEGMGLVRQMAKERGYQVWIESVSHGDEPTGFELVAGRIRSTPASRRKAEAPA